MGRLLNILPFQMRKNEHYVTLINSGRVLEMIDCEEIDDFYSSKADGFHSRLWDKCVNSEALFSHFHYVGKGSVLYMFKLRNYGVPSKSKRLYTAHEFARFGKILFIFFGIHIFLLLYV